MNNKQTRRFFFKTVGVATTSFILPGCGPFNSAKEKPNILWITCEDISPHLGCYGDKYAITPNLDQLASEGVQYENAFAAAPVCTPTRSTIITGVYASSMGTQHLRGQQPLSAQIKCFTEYLRDAGYYCSNNVKEDYNFQTPETAWDESSDTAHWRKRREGQPFFSIFNLTMTHQSRTRYGKDKLEQVNETLAPGERHDPKNAIVPPYYPDTPAVRVNLAALHTQITLLDKKVREILDQLEADGLAENTIVFFYSDHGDGLPRGKRFLHDTGLKVPFFIRFPEKYKHLAPVQAGGKVDTLINFVDLAPTILSLAGLSKPNYMHGKAFLGKRAEKENDYIIGIRDRVDEAWEFSRTVHDGRYQYIRNFLPHRPRMQRSFYSEITPIRQDLRRLNSEGKLEGHEQWLMRPDKPAEELYDTKNDPWELNNLAGLPDFQELLKSKRKILFDWMIKTRDTGLLPEAEIVSRSKGGSPYDMAQNDRTFPVKRILETAAMVGRGATKREQLIKALADTDSPVRYWAATGLAALGKDAQPAKNELRKVLTDKSPGVRFAAAEALCYIGLEKEAVPVLALGLSDTDVHVQLQAAQHLFVVGRKAQSAAPQIKKAIKQLEGIQDHGWYAREALTYLLNQIS